MGAALTPVALLGLYGAAKGGSALFNELRNVVFAKVRPWLGLISVVFPRPDEGAHRVSDEQCCLLPWHCTPGNAFWNLLA